MLRPDFMNGIAQLEACGLTYDLLLFPRHLLRAVELVKAFPNQRFVLDHLGKPFIKDGIMEPWRNHIARLAAFPNVWCKLSGMVTGAHWKNWNYEKLLPYMEAVLEAFGPGRIMVGSDWPVCRLAGEYTEVMKLVLRFTDCMDKRDQTKILYHNAVDCYQLKLNDNGEEKVKVT
jgi:L-fuconolactonase